VRRLPAGVRADPGPGLPQWDEADLVDLLERARSFRRVGPPALADPESLLREVVAGLFGVRSDGAGGRFELAPWLPANWRSMALRRLRCHRTLLSVEVRPRSEWATVRLEASFGPPIAVAVRLRNVGAIARVTVDEIALEGERAVFTLQGQHEVMFFFRGAA
jgi:glycosyl hydrolase family 65